jgi:hypothetical protein
MSSYNIEFDFLKQWALQQQMQAQQYQQIQYNQNVLAAQMQFYAPQQDPRLIKDPFAQDYKIAQAQGLSFRQQAELYKSNASPIKITIKPPAVRLHFPAKN